MHFIGDFGGFGSAIISVFIRSKKSDDVHILYTLMGRFFLFAVQFNPRLCGALMCVCISDMIGVANASV